MLQLITVVGKTRKFNSGAAVSFRLEFRRERDRQALTALDFQAKRINIQRAPEEIGVNLTGGEL